MSSAGAGLETIAVVIPAWRPDRTLVTVVQELKQRGVAHLTVVNDGSEPEFDPIFDELCGVEVLRHPANRGKGAALKTGIEHVLRATPGIIGIVTADADGQHLPDDILGVAQSLARHPDALILGSRAFSGHVPLRSRIGNTATRHLMRIVAGTALQDTQTGLRGIPSSFAASLLKLPANGYEFELSMLIDARQQGVEVIDEQIQTVYEPGNSSSHFNPLRDSVKIGSVLLRLPVILLAALLLDVFVFRLAFRHTASIPLAQIVSRTVAAVFTLATATYRTPIAGKRFLATAILTGAVSYACVELLYNTNQLSATLSKLAVESLLFFVNFHLQRDWVFRRSTDTKHPFSWNTAPLWLLLLLPAAIEVLGFRSAHLMQLDAWLPEGIRHFSRFVSCALAASVLFGVFARRYFVPAAVASVLVCSVYAVGFPPVGSVLLFVFSVTVLGRLLFGANIDGPLAMLAGTAVWIAAMSFTARLPVHYPATYLTALALPILVGFRHSRQLSSEWLAALRPRFRLSPAEFLPVVSVVFLLVADWLIVLQPEVSADGLAMHLTIPADMALHHAYTVDFHHLVWALMPMGADFCYSVVYMLGGEYAARLLNFAMLAGMGLLLFQCIRSFLSAAQAALLTALFLSSPMVYLITGSMFVENFVAFMVLGAVVALWRLHETRSTAWLFLTAVLLGSAMALKVGPLAVAFPCIVLMLVEFRRRRLLAAAALLLALALGSIPYAAAWRKTGNPFFPFQTGPFKSSPAGDIRDKTFSQPISWRTPYDLTFQTDRYFEGRPGSFGFQYLLFLPLVAGGLLPVRSFRARTAILLGGSSAIVIAAVQPNARYLYFTMPLLIVGAAASLAWLRSRDYRLFQAMTAAVVAAALANIWFLPAADWYHRNFYTAPLFSEAGRQEYLHQIAPVREAIAWINRTHPDEPVLMTGASDIAGLIPPVYLYHWHDYSFAAQIDAAKRPSDVVRLFRRYGIERMIVDRTSQEMKPAGRHGNPLGAVISACGEPEFSSGNIASLKLRPDCETAEISAPTDSRVDLDAVRIF